MLSPTDLASFNKRPEYDNRTWLEHIRWLIRVYGDDPYLVYELALALASCAAFVPAGVALLRVTNPSHGAHRYLLILAYQVRGLLAAARINDTVLRASIDTFVRAASDFMER